MQTAAGLPAKGRSVKASTWKSGSGICILYKSGPSACGQEVVHGVQAGAASLLLSTGSYLDGEPQFIGTLSFHMSGVQEFFERVKNEAEVVWPLEAMEYGQMEFGIRDCDGYTLAFAEALAGA